MLWTSSVDLCIDADNMKRPPCWIYNAIYSAGGQHLAMDSESPRIRDPPSSRVSCGPSLTQGPTLGPTWPVTAARQHCVAIIKQHQSADRSTDRFGWELFGTLAGFLAGKFCRGGSPPLAYPLNFRNRNSAWAREGLGSFSAWIVLKIRLIRNIYILSNQIHKESNLWRRVFVPPGILRGIACQQGETVDCNV